MRVDDWAAPQPSLKDQLTRAPYWFRLTVTLSLVMAVMHFSATYIGEGCLSACLVKSLEVSKATYSHVTGEELLSIGLGYWDGISSIRARRVLAEMAITDCGVASGIGIYYRLLAYQTPRWMQRVTNRRGQRSPQIEQLG